MADKRQNKATTPVAQMCNGVLIFAAKYEIWAKIAKEVS
jgi:hypothetical protein